jgi:ribosomal protein S27AE
MRFLNIGGPGVATDEEFCPNCHVLLDQRDDHKTCPLCRYDARQHGQRRRLRRQRR